MMSRSAAVYVTRVSAVAANGAAVSLQFTSTAAACDAADRLRREGARAVAVSPAVRMF